MNAITRLILRGVMSGNVTLTPQVLGALKAASEDHPGAEKPATSADGFASHPDASGGETPRVDKHPTAINPPPSRWIRRTGCAVGCVLMLGVGMVQAAVNPGKFEAANDAFAQGRFSEAARGYESIIAQQGWSAPVLFNLANAQQRDGQLGQAILNYERAALRAPGDPDIVANLHLARQKSGLAAEPRSHIENIAQLLTTNGWFCFAAAALFLLAVMPLLKQLRPGMRLVFYWGSVPAAFALALAAMAMAVQWPDLNRAIVTVPETVAGVSPVTMAQPSFKLRAGEMVKLKQTHKAFVLIENPAAQEGWVKASEVARVIP